MQRFYKARGKNDEAAAIDERFIGVIEKQQGADSKYLGPLLLDLAKLRTELKQYDRAEPVLRRLISIQEKAYGATNATLVPLLQMHADVLAKLDRNDEAKLARDRRQQIEKSSRSK